jgi:hypothetical protein
MNKALWRITLLAGLLVSGLLACTRSSAADPERVALEAQDVNALNASMTEDVELLDDATTVTGRDAVIRALRDVATRGKLVATSGEARAAATIARRVIDSVIVNSFSETINVDGNRGRAQTSV